MLLERSRHIKGIPGKAQKLENQGEKGHEIKLQKWVEANPSLRGLIDHRKGVFSFLPKAFGGLWKDLSWEITDFFLLNGLERYKNGRGLPVTWGFWNCLNKITAAWITDFGESGQSSFKILNRPVSLGKLYKTLKIRLITVLSSCPEYLAVVVLLNFKREHIEGEVHLFWLGYWLWDVCKHTHKDVWWSKWFNI